MGENDNIIRISVRSLVEFLLRSGSLEQQSGASLEAAMLEGARIHRALQKKAGGDYRAEVALKMDVPVPGTDAVLRLEGRADGIFSAGSDITTIDEIKTVDSGIHTMQEPQEVHLAQARCYAYIYACQKKLDRIDIRMTYSSRMTEEVRFFYEEWKYPELREWFYDLIQKYTPWVQLRLEFARLRQETIREMTFPFPYREGQYDLAAGVYRTIVHGRKLFLQAPTGTGKTIAVLFPALKAVGEGKADRIFYLTAKGVTGSVAMETLSLLQERGLRVRSIMLASKERVCPCESVDCRPESCPRAEGHYDRVNDALMELLGEAADGKTMTMERIGDCAGRYGVCPYELSMDAVDFADVIVCDYNYVFHPQARLTRYLGERTQSVSSRTILLIDEAHNLLERGRDMYSAELSASEVTAFRRSVRGVRPQLWKRMKGLVRILRRLSQEMKENVQGQRIHVFESWTGSPEQGELLTEVTEVLNQIHWILEQEDRSLAMYRAAADAEGSGPDNNDGELLTFYFGLSHFEKMLRELDSHYIVYGTNGVHSGGKKGFVLHLYCADPSGLLGSCMEKTRAAVFFSATFLPIQYYKGLLGGSAEDFEMYARSSFSSARRKVVIVRDVTSRYRDRNEKTYARIADGIRRIVTCRAGNYMVYFPSYAFLEEVLESFNRICSQEGSDDLIEVVAQKREMSDAERTEFLSSFEEVREGRFLVGFCVLGGMFGEGIDLRNDRLIGSLIVGTGIPPVEPQRDLLRDYFTARGRNGYDFAYRYPGMNKVLQAAGRVIRTEEDIGIVVLMDERFDYRGNRELFPIEWDIPESVSSVSAALQIRSFWDSLTGGKSDPSLPG